MVSLTLWTWVWASYGSWWWTGKPGMLQSMGSQRAGHDWATELNWTYKKGSLGTTDLYSGKMIWRHWEKVTIYKQAVVPEATRSEERGMEHIVPHSPQEEPTMPTVWLPASSTGRQYIYIVLFILYKQIIWHPLETDTIPKGKEEAGKGCSPIMGEERLRGE